MKLPVRLPLLEDSDRGTRLGLRTHSVTGAKCSDNCCKILKQHAKVKRREIMDFSKKNVRKND